MTVRIIYSDDPGGVDSVRKNPNKVFAVVGPFDCHMDKQDLQDAIEDVITRYNQGRLANGELENDGRTR